VVIIGGDCVVLAWVEVSDDELPHPDKSVVAAMNTEASTRRNWVIVGLLRVGKNTRGD
jgi:hypothetical protein